MASEPNATDAPGPSRGDRKRAVILEAAQAAFFANGFVGTSMDQVAATAAVSKQTVYKHFGDKETLFREVVTDVVRAREGGIPADLFSAGQGSIEARLRTFARLFLQGVMRPEVIKLRRLVIGEAGRFPELGHAFFSLGQQRGTEQLAAALAALATSRDISMDDPVLAAHHFLSLILSGPLDRAMFLGAADSLSDAALDRYADAGVVAFVRAYGLADDQMAGQS